MKANKSQFNQIPSTSTECKFHNTHNSKLEKYQNHFPINFAHLDASVNGLVSHENAFKILKMFWAVTHYSENSK